MVIKYLNILDMSQIYTPHVGYSESKGRLLNFQNFTAFLVFGYFPLRITETWFGDLANKEGISYPRSLGAQNIWQCRITMCRIGKQHWLVVYLPLWKIWKSVGMIIPNIWKHKNVLNHQPEQHFEASFDNKGHIVFPCISDIRRLHDSMGRRTLIEKSPETYTLQSPWLLTTHGVWVVKLDLRGTLKR